MHACMYARTHRANFSPFLEEKGVRLLCEATQIPLRNKEVIAPLLRAPLTEESHLPKVTPLLWVATSSDCLTQGCKVSAFSLQFGTVLKDLLIFGNLHRVGSSKLYLEGISPQFLPLPSPASFPSTGLEPKGTPS